MNEFRRIAVFARVGGADCSNLNGKIPKIRGIVGIEREDFCLDVVSQINRSHLPYVLDWAAARGISGMDQMQNLHPASDYRISLSIWHARIGRQLTKGTSTDMQVALRRNGIW